MTVIMLVVMILITSSTAAAIDITQDDWDEQFNGASDSYDPLYGNSEELDVAAVNVTDEKVRFKANISDGVSGGLDSSNGLQVYIDSEPSANEGLTKETATGGLSTYFGGLESMSADYRVSVTDNGVPVIQEHVEDTTFETIKRIDIEEDGDQVALEIDRATIGNPDPFQVKFAYVEQIGAVGSKSNFVWAPDNAVELPNGTEIENAEVNASVEFGEEKVDDDATVNFTLRDDNGVVDEKGFNYSDNGVLNHTFTKNKDNFEGQVEVEVEVFGDTNYSTDRTGLNNTVTISQNGLDAKRYNEYVALSTVEAGVTFGTEEIDDGDSIEYTLTDNDDTKYTEENSSFNLDDTPLNKTFTINPYNFNEDGKLRVELNDEDYPLDKTKDIDSITAGESLSSADGSQLVFDADTIGHDFTLNVKQSSRNFDSHDKFTLEVYLESIENNDGKNITNITHVINFDEDLHVEDKDKNVTFIDINSSDADIDVDDEKEINIDNDEGRFEANLLNLSDHVVTNGSNETLYEIEFEFDEGLQAETDQGEENALEFNPNTDTDETVIENLTSGNELSFTSSNNDPVQVTNQNTELTDITVTHRSDGSDMVGTPSIIFVDVSTNEGELDQITLNDTENGTVSKLPQSGDEDNLVIDCEESKDNSTCSGELIYTPKTENATSSPEGGYSASFEFNITVKDSSGQKYYLPNQPTVEEDFETEVYYFGDVSKTTSQTTVEADDVREVLLNVGEESGGLPWEDAESDLARADIDNDGEITMSDVTVVYNQFQS